MMDNNRLGHSVGAGASLICVVEKITNLLAHENISIRKLDDAEIRENNLTKHRLLHDLNMAASQAKRPGEEPEMIPRLKDMSFAIRENMRFCSASVEAVREVLDMVLSAAIEGEKDGTYKIDNFPKWK